MVKAKHTVVNFLKTLNYGTYLIDLFVLLFLIVFIQLEENILSGIKTIVPEAFYIELFNEGSNIQLAGLMVALPSVLSIVVLVISIGKSNVLGTKIYKINSLRGPCCYSLLHFSILSVLMLAALTILSVFKLQMSLLYLDLAAAFISIYFLVQEIPLLSNSELATKLVARGIFRRVIRNIDDINIDKDVLLVLENNETFLQISGFLVFDLGLDGATNYLVKNKGLNNKWKIIRILVKAEETVLNSLINGKRGTIFVGSDGDVLTGYSIGKAFDGAAENLTILLKAICGDNSSTLITEAESKTTTYDVKTIYCEDARKLTKLLESVEIFYFKDDDAAKSKLQDAVLSFDGLLENDKFFYVPYQLAVEGLINEDFWFLEKTVLAQYPISLFSCYPAYLLFVASLLSFLKNRKLLTPEGSKKLNDFVSKRVSLPGGRNACFKNDFLYTVSIAASPHLVSSIDQMIRAMHSLDAQLLFLSENRNFPTTKAINPFKYAEIIGTWIETILLIGPKKDYAKKFGKKIKSLANESETFHGIIRSELLEIMEQQFRGSMSKAYSLHRLFSLKPAANLEKNLVNEELVNDVWEFFDFSEAKLQNSLVKKPNQRLNVCDNLKVPVLPNGILLQSNMDDLPNKKIYCHELLPDEGQMRFNEIVAFEIRKLVEDNAKNVVFVESSVEAAGQYTKYFPCHGNFLNLLPQYRIDGGVSKFEKELSREIKNYLPQMTLFKDGSIQFCVLLLSDKMVTQQNDIRIAAEDFNPLYGDRFKYAYQNPDFYTLCLSTKKGIEERAAKSSSLRKISFEIFYRIDPDNFVIIRKKGE